ncbi:MAG: recombinase family protein, partial [Eubacterium sp.]|nr:recombinase family protein [Eubacterium sp.]
MKARIIPASKTIGTHARVIEEDKPLRVAAYCRVSTDREEQESSYEVQCQHYTRMIDKNTEWELAGIYADEGITALSTKKREQFKAMIRDCEDGKIDMIITKSISRFARNTLDCLDYIRRLNKMGIPVVFEKESINTMDAQGELLITILASIAQQESESISKNVQMGIRFHYQEGKICAGHQNMLGYERTEDGSLEVIPEEAEIVRRIFRLFLNGLSPSHIG